MPFEVKGSKPLTEKIAVRLAPDEKALLQEDAELAGLSMSELVRRRYFGRKIIADTDMSMIRELRRIGGLLKHVHNQSDGAYSRDTADALHQLTSYIKKLSNDRKKDSV
jgi:hypothetical protein